MDISNDAKLKKLAQKQVSTDASESTSELLNWNNLEYTMPVTSSVASSRNVKEYPAERTSYESGQSITFVVQTASQYVDWSQSMLTFVAEFELTLAEAAKSTFGLTADIFGESQDLNYSSDAGRAAIEEGLSAFGDLPEAERKKPSYDTQLDRIVAHFGAGSACNFIDQVVVQSRSGVEIFRIEEFDKYRVIQDRMTEPEEFFDREGALMGYTKGLTSIDKLAPTVIDGNGIRHQATPFLVDNEKNAFIKATGDPTAGAITLSKRFVIPLSKLGGIFDSSQLCPAVMASGLRVNLHLKRDIAEVIGGVGVVCRPLISSVRERQNVSTPAQVGLEVANIWGVEREYIPVGGYVKYGGKWMHHTQVPSPGSKTNAGTEDYISPRFSVSALSSDFTLSEVALHIDTTLLVDSATHQLSKTAASKGLTLTFDQCYHQRFEAGSSATTNGVLSKAVSRAIMATGGTYSTPSGFDRTDQTTKIPLYAADLNIPLPVLGKFRFRLGSEYYPQQHVPNTLAAYWTLMRSFGQLDMKSVKSRLQKSDFLTWAQWFSATFERSAILKYSGQPINNSRTLSFEVDAVTNSADLEDHLITRDITAAVSTSKIHLWLEYMSVAQTFINNAIVKI